MASEFLPESVPRNLLVQERKISSFRLVFCFFVHCQWSLLTEKAWFSEQNSGICGLFVESAGWFRSQNWMFPNEVRSVTMAPTNGIQSTKPTESFKCSHTLFFPYFSANSKLTKPLRCFKKKTHDSQRVSPIGSRPLFLKKKSPCAPGWSNINTRYKMTSYDTTPVPTGKGAASFWRGSWWFQADFVFFAFQKSKVGNFFPKSRIFPQIFGWKFHEQRSIWSHHQHCREIAKVFLSPWCESYVYWGGHPSPAYMFDTCKMVVVSGNQGFCPVKTVCSTQEVWISYDFWQNSVCLVVWWSLPRFPVDVESYFTKPLVKKKTTKF